MNSPFFPMEQYPKSTVRRADRELSLADLNRETWDQLAAAPTQKENRFKNFMVATVTPDGLPDVRTVVLRQADPAARQLWFHTDVRAEKVGQLQAQPEAMLVFWDEQRQVQLRCRVRTTLHTTGAVADAQWANTWEGSRKMYLSEYEPGSVLPKPYPGFPEHLGENLPSRDESEAGRVHFAVVECRVLQMDYLHLSRAGQTRARFTFSEPEQYEWLSP